MGRKADLTNDDDDDAMHQSPSGLTRLIPNSTKHESQLNNPNSHHRSCDENRLHDDGNDLLIHDTILPHRKRVRKDTLQYLQPQQSTMSSSEILDVSLLDYLYLFIYIDEN
ncbi:unnamed protein product [Adineta ricciae]|uniref:Uncharacterized protein n=1 Tax=Adineta ricciae TaxID=249248 RepID=A0A816HB34_ADIRI|nr:unnamed protein product [Adineta ricciae]